MNLEEFEHIIKKVLYRYRSSGDLEQEWELLEKRLDGKKKKDRAFIWLFPLLLIGLFLGYSWWNNPTDADLLKNKSTVKEQLSKPERIVSESEPKTTFQPSSAVTSTGSIDNRKEEKIERSALNTGTQRSQLERASKPIPFSNKRREVVAIYQQQENRELKEKIKPLEKITSPIFKTISPQSIVADTSLPLFVRKEIKAEKVKNKNWQLHLITGIGLTQNKYFNNGGRLLYLQAIEESESNLESIFSGIHLHKKLSNHFSLFSGVEFTIVNERFDAEDYIQETQVANAATYRRQYLHFNQYHFLDIPLGINYFNTKRNWSYHFSVGGSYNVYLDKKGLGINENFVIAPLEDIPLYATNKGFTSFLLSSVQWKINKDISLNTGIRLHYGFGNLLNSSLYQKRQLGSGLFIGIQWSPLLANKN